MEANETFTDRLVSEILKSKLSVEDQKILIYKRYDQKGFTMIGARKEVRIVQERIQDNMVNKFDDIIATTLTILGACVSYLIIDSIFERGIVGIVLKILMPIIVFAVLSSVFSETLKEIKERCSAYKLCLVILTDILDDIETEYRMVQMKKAIESDKEEGNIFNINKSKDEDENEVENEDEEGTEEVEIDSFEFDFDDEDLEIA